MQQLQIQTNLYEVKVRISKKTIKGKLHIIRFSFNRTKISSMRGPDKSYICFSETSCISTTTALAKSARQLLHQLNQRDNGCIDCAGEATASMIALARPVPGVEVPSAARYYIKVSSLNTILDDLELELEK